MKQVSKVEFVQMFSEEMKKGRKISLDMTSVLKCGKDIKKTDNPYVGSTITKSVSLSGMAGCDYSNMVNAQLGREDKEQTFVSQPRTWGTHVNEYFVEHKGNYYLQMKVEASSTPVYRIDGEVVETAKLEPFLYAKKDPNTQAELDKKVVIRDVKLDNLKVIRFNGEEIVIV